MVYTAVKARFTEGDHLLERELVDNFKTLEAAEAWAKKDRAKWQYIAVAENDHLMAYWPRNIKTIKETEKYKKIEEAYKNEWEKIQHKHS